MSKNGYFLLLLGVLSGVAAVHATALQHDLYWYHRWLDMPMHFFGGFFVAGAILWYVHFLQGYTPKKRFAILLASIAVFIIGGLWEAYEYMFGIAVQHGEIYVFDTVKDMFFNFLGATVATVYILYARVHQEQEIRESVLINENITHV